MQNSVNKKKNMPDAEELVNHYKRYFYTVRANTSQHLKQAYQLRYKVFIEECKYNIGDYNDTEKTEMDEYDEYSMHGLLFHKPTNKLIGYIRLIPYNKAFFNALPFEDYANHSIDSSSLSTDQLRSERIGEISRMCLLPSFRRRKFEQTYLHVPDKKDQFTERRFPINYLPMCLSFISINLMHQGNLDSSVAMMEKPLSVLIKQYGVRHKQIGKFIDYCGNRAPFMILPNETYHALPMEVLGLYKVIGKELGLPSFDNP